jgi:hypothetical protein
MFRIRAVATALSVAGLAGLLGVPAATASTTAKPEVPTLVAIRAAHHPGYDRLVFEFRGGLPGQRSVGYVSKVIAESGKKVRVVGSATLLVRFFAASGHDSDGHVTYGTRHRTYALPGLIQVVTAGDFENVLRFAVGVASREAVHMFTLTSPSRVVVDIRTPRKTVVVHDFLLISQNFNSGHQPYLRAVDRPVIKPALAFGALQRLFAGATDPERALGLRFVASKATGFTNLSITDGIARVRLTGGCGSGGSTFTIANEIMPTLRQFSSVHWVKIYDPAGHTERPTGHTDSIPVCLEP